MALSQQIQSLSNRHSKGLVDRFEEIVGVGVEMKLKRLVFRAHVDD